MREEERALRGHPDIVELINHPLKLAERGPTKKRVMDCVKTFIQGFAA